MADKYILKVTAGPSYDDQTPINPNSETPFAIRHPKLSSSVTLRVQNYRGLPEGSPKTSPYFSHPSHKSDLYSLQFSVTPTEDLPAHDIVLGNDFDHPIRDKLPPGFDQAFKIVKWFIDPGLEGDVYSDNPGLFGPLLSSVNTFRVGGKDSDGPASTSSDSESDDEHEVKIVREGSSGSSGAAVRSDNKIPADAAARKKFFLQEAHLKAFTFEKGRTYDFDFFNPYLDFNDFALRLPGFSVIPGITIPVISYWDGQPLRSHAIRYVLKNRATGEPLFVVIFTLIPKDDLEKEQKQLEHEKDASAEGKATNDEEDLD
ncbi:DUF1769-domain-containing protein [Myriangium duriaei CBS 260.36]|uniref:DUF1769-domain-containing protein n=1 Tax=Myriangium duriaei CBS 260.36 TaxID=1168546 RepID=A0A9P4MKL4_9PEZI|nr:DUF1769-domain-containing protein [Myriangium duriaei CBS 260.36]